MPLSRKPISKGEKTLFAVCIFVVLPLAAVVYIAGNRDAEPKWNIPAAASRPTPNGYDFYVAAAKATFRFTPEVDPASDTRVYVPNSPYSLKNYSLARREKWLKANTRTFALVSQGLSTPSMTPDYATNSLSDWSRLRQLARDIGVRSRTLQMQNQPMKATMSVLDGMQMAQDGTREGGLLARLVGIAILAISRNPLDDWNKTINALSATEARTATRRLEAMLSKEPTAAQVQTVDKRINLLDLRRAFATPGWRRMLDSGSAAITQGLPHLWQTQTISKQTIYDNMNRALDAKIANAALPYSKSQNVSFPPHLDVFTTFLMGSPGNRIVMNEARNSTSNNMLLLRLALRGYIAEHGVAPPNLGALTPSYLKSIPADVYSDGKPLFYSAQGKSYKLWSVGPDGINDGGVPLARRPGDKGLYPVSNRLDNKGDFVAGLCR